ncbi:MAG: hypothetical protein RMJ37_00800 [Spirochaetia bacterium]|nr:diadenylate cyclase [Spirochaetota bacterium]MCX8097253.1 diadenylate cyclase [Spirochaetota bacterium]MDW8111861.1 hypothetical protein [Spirochaetia bacterium]
MLPKLDTIKENLETFISEVLSLIFFYQSPGIETEIVSKDMVKKIKERTPGQNIYHYAIPKYKDKFVRVKVSYHRVESYTLPESIPSFFEFLMDDIVNKFLSGISDISSIMFSDKEEILRNISKRFINRLFEWLGYERFSSEKLFFLLNFLSNETYEGKKLESKIIFIPRNEKVDMVFTNQTEFDRRNYRVIRKILQLASSGKLVIVGYNDKIVGLSRISNYKEYRSILFQLREDFWEIMISDASLSKSRIPKELFERIEGIEFLPIIRFKNGFPETQRTSINKTMLRNIIKSTFKDIDEDKVKKLTKLITEVSVMDHGLILIITTQESAKYESERLSNRIFRIEPFKLIEDNSEVNRDIMSAITSIDGAIIADTDGICYGIGIILDGDVSSVEKPSRGSRYNSSLRYIESRNNNAIAIVLSDDGMFDIISPEDIQNKKMEEVIESLISQNIIVL